MALRTGWLTAAAVGALFAVSVVTTIGGMVLPALAGRLRLDFAQTGGLVLVLNLAMVGASLVSGPLFDRYGLRAPLVAAPLLLAAALWGIGGAASFAGLLAAAAIAGAGGGALFAAGNTLAADVHTDPHRKNAALNLAGAAFAFGSLALPFAVGGLIEGAGPSLALDVAALLTLPAAAIAAGLRFPPPKLRAAAGEPLLGEPVVPWFAAALFLALGNEFLLAGYIGPFVIAALRATPSAAGYVLAAYWAAIAVARLLASRVLTRTPGERLLAPAAVMAALFALVLAFSHHIALAGVAAAALGLSLAGIFPTTLGLASGRFPERSGALFGTLIAIGLMGAMTLPWLAGQVGARYSPRGAMGVVVCGFLAIAAIERQIGRKQV